MGCSSGKTLRCKFERYTGLSELVNTAKYQGGSTFPDVHDKSSWDGWNVNPLSGEILDLQTSVGGSLQQLRKKSSVFLVG
jgi:hypothetical protein